MDEEQKPPEQQENKPEAETKESPEPSHEQQPQQSQEEKEPGEQKAQEATTSQEKTQTPSPQPPPDMQQPHLVQSKKGEAKSRRLPPKSFITAILIISLAIAIGIGAALFLGRLTKKELKQKTTEKSFKPQVTSVPTTIPTVTENSSTKPKEATSGNFESLLNQQQSKEATSSETVSATQEAAPSQ